MSTPWHTIFSLFSIDNLIITQAQPTIFALDNLNFQTNNHSVISTPFYTIGYMPNYKVNLNISFGLNCNRLHLKK